MFELLIKSNYTSTFTIECEPGDTIGMLKNKIKNKLYCDENNITVCRAGKKLSDSISIEQAGFVNCDIVNVIKHEQENNFNISETS